NCSETGSIVCVGDIGPVDELCDELDNDCDAAVDEDYPNLGNTCDGNDTDLCEEGVFVCSDGDQVCSDDTGDDLESCNELDDDCDGSIDEDFTGKGDYCEDGVGECLSSGEMVCNGDGTDTMCNAIPGDPVPETCNTLDDDCDGSTDEDFPDLGNACDGLDSDLCEEGIYACEAGDQVCTDDTGDILDTCNGQDDDCNPATPDGSDELWLGDVCDGPDSDFCEEGIFACSEGGQVCTDETGDNVEACNGLDDDCDTEVDEDFPLGNECTVGTGACLASGFFICSGTGGVMCDATAGDPTTELCDGIDNDCNGIIDDGFPETGVQCGITDVGECEYGLTQCSESGVICVGNIDPVVEICDGLDNNCDGEIDNTGDSDGDGMDDCLDECPDDPDKIELGVCGCGVADVDNNEDTFMDCIAPPTCYGRTVTIHGTPGDDLIILGTDGPDVIHGYGGNDTIFGMDGDDIICGGPGNDTIDGGWGNDQAWGEQGNDSITGDDGNDTLRGNDGDDYIHGNMGRDRIYGNDGNDTLRGGKDNDRIYGNDGDDHIYGDLGNDRVYGDKGNDTLEGGDGEDNLSGGLGNDTILCGEGDDEADGGFDDDEIHGGGGADTLEGGSGNDEVYGDAGDDELDGDNGNDFLDGGEGDDVLDGSLGLDTLIGRAGNDELDGGSHDDILCGNSGDDVIEGGTNNDLLDGGADTDKLSGDLGVDQCFNGENVSRCEGGGVGVTVCDSL
ncbi:hypothetical protein KKC44_06780, partial [Patescibacteria group bacterium]|nr:hypothetical protein [Patescibacteria group bacterium]